MPKNYDQISIAVTALPMISQRFFLYLYPNLGKCCNSSMKGEEIMKNVKEIHV